MTKIATKGKRICRYLKFIFIKAIQMKLFTDNKHD
jgi:hypothetical protein